MVTTGQLRWWLVHTEPYCYDFMCADPAEPQEMHADILYVEATSKRKAILRAVRHWLRTGDGYVQCNIDKGSPPWKGVRAEPHPKPERGNPDCIPAEEGKE